MMRSFSLDTVENREYYKDTFPFTALRALADRANSVPPKLRVE